MNGRFVPHSRPPIANLIRLLCETKLPFAAAAPMAAFLFCRRHQLAQGTIQRSDLLVAERRQ